MSAFLVNLISYIIRLTRHPHDRISSKEIVFPESSSWSACSAKPSKGLTARTRCYSIPIRLWLRGNVTRPLSSNRTDTVVFTIFITLHRGIIALTEIIADGDPARSHSFLSLRDAATASREPADLRSILDKADQRSCPAVGSPVRHSLYAQNRVTLTFTTPLSVMGLLGASLVVRAEFNQGAV